LNEIGWGFGAMPHFQDNEANHLRIPLPTTKSYIQQAKKLIVKSYEIA